MSKAPAPTGPTLRRRAVAVVCWPSAGGEEKEMSSTTRSGFGWATTVTDTSKPLFVSFDSSTKPSTSASKRTTCVPGLSGVQ